jgi:hypothetical protein
MLDDVFSVDGMVHATLPGHGTTPEQEKLRPKVRKSLHEFCYPRLTREQVAVKHIKLPEGKVVQVQEASSEEFLTWYLAQLRAVSFNNNSFGHIREGLLTGIDVSALGMIERWYLLEEMMHLPRYIHSNVQLFIEDIEAGAA